MSAKKDTQTRAKKEARDTFEQVLGRLEKIVVDLEEGEMPLENALEAFEEGIKLSQEAARRLDAAERRIETLLADGGIESTDIDNAEKNG